MDMTQAEALKLKILERRNYLKEIEPSLTYSKRNLYRGMQNRVRRKNDKAFKGALIKQQGLATQKLKTVDDYITNLSIYEDSLNNSGGLTVQSVSIAPMPPEVTLPSIPNSGKARMVRRIARGIRNRRFI